MNENVMDQHFHLPRNVRKDFRVPLWQQPIHKRLLPQRHYLNKSGGSKQKQTTALHQG